MPSFVPDQWSPLNPEGKKHYDRNFLLQVRFAEESLQKPEGLQIPDILLDSVSILSKEVFLLLIIEGA